MHVALTPQQQELQLELRTYFTNLMTPEVKERIRRAGSIPARFHPPILTDPAMPPHSAGVPVPSRSSFTR